MVVVVMGVSGSGKTTVGEQLAGELGWLFFDADAFHPEANVAKMARGEPLTDADRVPWLDAIRAQIDALLEDGTSAVITCSALKASYRRRLGIERDAVHLIYLKGSYALIHQRMTARAHFFKPDMLKSQFDALEEPAYAVTVDINQSIDAIVDQIRHVLGV